MTTSSTVVTTTTEEKRLSTGISFNELDIALKKVAKEQDEVNVEVTLPSKNRRARSLSRNNTETLPDEVFFVLSKFTKSLQKWEIILSNPNKITNELQVNFLDLS